MRDQHQLTGPIIQTSDLPIVDGRAGASTIEQAMRRRFRMVNWALVRSPQFPETTYILTCTTCGENSGESLQLEPPQDWALQHGARTKHTSYHEDMRTKWDVRPVDEVPTDKSPDQ